MKPIEFEGQTHVLAKDQKEYQPLPVFVDLSKKQTPMVSCWQLTEEELKKIAETGVIWISQWTFGNHLQPLLPTVNREDVIPPKDQVEKQDFVEHYVYDMKPEDNMIQRCVSCNAIICDYTNTMAPAGSPQPKGFPEGVVYVSKTANPTIYVTEKTDEMNVEKCKPKKENPY